jgi:hypothetical protein
MLVREVTDAEHRTKALHDRSHPRGDFRCHSVEQPSMIRWALMWAGYDPGCVRGFGESVEKGNEVSSGRYSTGSSRQCRA